ncbi:hypothetical protein GCM10007989_16930 [Devosia pacifica]|uniref:O-antigen ligase-related domain-containing protein n=1 Tax=Devosia pacifica TaxID=1335967 RepID=A0A918S3N0_9HYPH|nr:O-antigen ligase family protein [Devosia pacifica]GHA22165.1 hypothetical protein GCM10007989_16930 [Devosia pacifica]
MNAGDVKNVDNRAVTLVAARGWLAIAAMTVALATPAGLPEAANIAFFVFCGLAIVGAPLFAWKGLLQHPGITLPLVATLLLLGAFSLSAEGPQDLLAIYLFTPLFLTAPMAALLGAGGRQVSLERAALAASAGAFFALAVALFDVTVAGHQRAGFSVNNPLHFAAIALTLGFLPPAAIPRSTGWRRTVMLCAPAAGAGAVILSGSRGPILAILPVLVIAIFGYLFMIGVRVRRLVLAMALGLMAVALLLTLAWLGVLPGGGTLHQVAAIITSGEAPDDSVAQRLLMYQSAYNAFLAAPVFGHGMADFIAITASYAPAGTEMPTYDHLHNDIADFAVIGGLVGLVSYLLIIFAPLFEAARAPHHHRGPAVYLALVLATAYLALGLTNAVFGIITQTVLFGFMAAYIVNLARAGTGALQE